MNGFFSATAWAMVGMLAVPLPTARLRPAAVQGFQKYVAAVEGRIAKQHMTPAAYVATLQKPGALAHLKAGAALTEPVNGGTWEIQNGLLHHWRGAAFVAGAKATDMLALLRDYQNLAKIYAPEMERCTVLANTGDASRLLLRLKKQKINTVVFEGEFDLKTGLTGQTSGFEISRSLHIRQIDDPGTPQEKKRPEGNDDGLLWRLNTYWSFVEVEGGLVMECEAVSLTRDIPFGAGWLVTPIISELPRESLDATLRATERALLARVGKGTSK